MLLVDSEIKKLGNSVIINGFNEKNIHSISYDIFVDKIITPQGESDHYILPSLETVYIKTKEEILVPDNLMIQVGQRNSLMRLGFQVDAPFYHPGHQTYMFIRVRNISANDIDISNGDPIGQLFFWTLSTKPEQTYSQQPNASFNNESKYRQFGNYKQEYEKKIHKIEKVSENLEETESRIYGNLLTMMGIFVSIFSLVVVNFNIVANSTPSLKTIYTVNGSLMLVITFMVGLIFSLLNFNKHNKNKNTLTMASIIYAIIFLIFSISLYFI